MMKKFGFVVALLVIVILMTGISGCNDKNAQMIGTAIIPPGADYPVNTDETLTIWSGLGLSSSHYVSANDFPYVKELQKKTGIKVSYVHPPKGQINERLSIMLASGDVTDIINYNWANYAGGPEKALKEGHIERLNNLMDSYAPNMKALVKSYPEIDKLAKTNNGDYYTFPSIKIEEEMLTTYGPIVRKDWLDDLGLDLPETLEDWYIMLTAFKEKKGASSPMVLELFDMEYCGMFFGAYGIKPGFYVENNKIKYGPLESGYKETLVYLNKLFSEGLLDQNLTGIPLAERDALILNNHSGAIISYLNSGIRNWQSNSAVAGTPFKLTATKYPTLNRGEIAKFGARVDQFIAVSSISALSDKKELAAKYLDYSYTEEGHMLANFGIEGESYCMKDGEPVYTDLILNNPDGLSLSAALGVYANAGTSGAYRNDLRAFMLVNDSEQHRTAIELWSKTREKEHDLPSTLSLSDEDSSLEAKIMTDIKTYVESMFFKFVAGIEPIDNFDRFVEQIKKMGIEKVIQMKQNSLDEFNRR